MTKVKFILNNKPNQMTTYPRNLNALLKENKWKLGYDYDFSGSICIFKTQSKIERVKQEVARVLNLNLPNVNNIEIFE